MPQIVDYFVWLYFLSGPSAYKAGIQQVWTQNSTTLSEISHSPLNPKLDTSSSHSSPSSLTTRHIQAAFPRALQKQTPSSPASISNL